MKGQGTSTRGKQKKRKDSLVKKKKDKSPRVKEPESRDFSPWKKGPSAHGTPKNRIKE